MPIDNVSSMSDQNSSQHMSHELKFGDEKITDTYQFLSEKSSKGIELKATTTLKIINIFLFVFRVQ